MTRLCGQPTCLLLPALCVACLACVVVIWLGMLVAGGDWVYEKVTGRDLLNG